MLNLYSTGEELFRLMEEAEASRNVKSFFIMDENFLLQRERAMDLLARMKAAGKSWAFNIFSSANAIRKYTYEELVELGVSSIWLGLESAQSGYAKLQGADTLQLTRELREHGIVLLGSTILGLEHHTPQNIGEEIERAVAHQTDLHQFMLYTPVPGTPLYDEMADQGRLLDDVDLADIHGQDRFNFRHAAISREESKKFLESAFRWDFVRNGPSLFRVCRTTFQGWMRYKDHPDPRVRERFRRETRMLRHAYAAVLWAMEHRLKNANRSVAPRIRALRKEIEQEFGFVAAAASRILGPVLWWTGGWPAEIATNRRPSSGAGTGRKHRRATPVSTGRRHVRGTCRPLPERLWKNRLAGESACPALRQAANPVFSTNPRRGERE
jgi:hypothetical protein